MKTIFFLIAAILSSMVYAQNGINYKALIKDSSGNIASSSSVQIQFAILQDITTIYTETHSATTDANGIVIVTIGEGNTSDVFSDINWSTNDHYLNTQIDTGNGYEDFGNTPFNAVPYALHTLNPQGLKPVDEGNGIGWRLAERDPENYGNIGLNAIDLGYNSTISTTRGATGDFSVVLGSQNEASSTYAVAIGRFATASESGANAIGSQVTASGISSVSIGHLSEAIGNYSATFGSQNEASGDNAVAIGSQNEAIGDYSLAMGRNTNATGSYSTSMGRMTTAASYATALGDLTSATGSYATSIGRESTASGLASTAMGHSTLASSNNATAMGFETQATAASTTAMGSNTIASGNFATAMGHTSEASGAYSTAMGYSSAASGFISTALGRATTAPSYAETVIGAYNTNYTPNETLSWNANDRIFVIGNGQSGSRSNAMVVLKNGNTGIGTDNPQERLHISNGRLRIGSETIEDTGSNQLSFNASLLPDQDNAMRLGNSSNRWLSVWAADGTINTSDRREKKNIETLTYGLEEVLKMKPVSFNWKNNNNPDTKLGLIAQDVQILVPEVVKSHIWERDEVTGELTKKEMERLGVYYSDLVPVLIKAIQEQQNIIENQKDQLSRYGNAITEQSKLLEALLTRVESLEKHNNQ